MQKVITILEDNLAEVAMSGCSQPGAGTKIILHTSHWIQMDLNHFYVSITDTDVVVLLVAFMPDLCLKIGL